jgi:hypothetical protein
VTSCQDGNAATVVSLGGADVAGAAVVMVCIVPIGPQVSPSARKAPEAPSDKIGVRVGKIVNQYKVAKHFELAIDHNSFTFARKLDAIAEESARRWVSQFREMCL